MTTAITAATVGDRSRKAGQLAPAEQHKQDHQQQPRDEQQFVSAFFEECVSHGSRSRVVRVVDAAIGGIGGEA
jgi:hypothetical protein